jgi:hypothetical protein
MRMSVIKWFLVAALLLAAAIFAYIRISEAITNFQVPDTQPQQFQPEPPVWGHDHDQLIRT